LTWTDGGSSPISSMNAVPPSAASRSPAFARTAPVKAPSTCPKTSLSKSDSDSAAAWMRTSGPSARREKRWMRSAKTSFPVPVSPSSSTGRSVTATLRMIASSSASASVMMAW
jgi:hypothetical protein